MLFLITITARRFGIETEHKTLLIRLRVAHAEDYFCGFKAKKKKNMFWKLFHIIVRGQISIRDIVRPIQCLRTDFTKYVLQK